MSSLSVDSQTLFGAANSGTMATLEAKYWTVFGGRVSLGFFQSGESQGTRTAREVSSLHIRLRFIANARQMMIQASLSPKPFAALDAGERSEIGVLSVQMPFEGHLRREDRVALVANHPRATFDADRDSARDSRFKAVVAVVVLLVLGGVGVDGRDLVPLGVVSLVDAHLVLVVEPFGANAAHEGERGGVREHVELQLVHDLEQLSTIVARQIRGFQIRCEDELAEFLSLGLVFFRGRFRVTDGLGQIFLQIESQTGRIRP